LNDRKTQGEEREREKREKKNAKGRENFNFVIFRVCLFFFCGKAIIGYVCFLGAKILLRDSLSVDS
jgi:hypothetical protein